jgi:LuxR family transcriptional regulator, quorum-sensing system regulator BjaR1
MMVTPAGGQSMLARIMSHAEKVLSAPTQVTASTALFDAFKPLGASYLQTRHYYRPSSVLTPESHFAAGGVITRVAPSAWPGSAAYNYICFDQNPLISAIREGRTRYRFSDFAPHDNPGYGSYWSALGEARIAEALCATSYGADGAIASLHLGFDHADFDPEEALEIQLAGLMLTERLMTLGKPARPRSSPLSRRERDCLALVADGKTDWEISVILSISEATARFHVDNARRKLQAVNRAQAVAKLANLRLI